MYVDNYPTNARSRCSLCLTGLLVDLNGAFDDDFLSKAAYPPEGEEAPIGDAIWTAIGEVVNERRSQVLSLGKPNNDCGFPKYSAS